MNNIQKHTLPTRESWRGSRGWRNNNPLNIRRGEDWCGLRPVQTDPAFCQFLTMAYGYRAAAKVLRSYYHYFKQTGKEWRIDTILNRWAPPTENDTSAYIDRVLPLMGRTWGNMKLADPTTRPGALQTAYLMAAMTCVECGCPPSAVPVGSLNTGFVLAGYLDPNLPTDWYKASS